MEERNKCKCGNWKSDIAKRCSKCHHNKKGRGSVGRGLKYKRKYDLLSIEQQVEGKI